MMRIGTDRLLLLGWSLTIGLVLSTVAPGLAWATVEAGSDVAAPPVPPGPEAAPSPDRPGPIPAPPEPEHLRDMIETLRIVRLTQALRLNEEEAARLAVRLREVDEQRRELEKIHREIFPKIEETLREVDRENREVPEGRLRELMDKLRVEEERHRAKIEELEKRVREALTLEQQARMMLFQGRFEHEVREMIGMARAMDRPPEAPGPAPRDGPHPHDVHRPHDGPRPDQR